MVICLCHRISDGDIARAAAGGCTSFAELQDDTRVATACGACRDHAAEAFASHHGAGHGCGRCAQLAAVQAPSALPRIAASR